MSPFNNTGDDMASLSDITRQIKEQEAELARLHNERAKLQPGDREGASRLRTFIAATSADIEDLKRDAAVLEAYENSTERAAQRAAGRAALAAARELQPTIAKLWEQFDKALVDAIAVANELDGVMARAGQHASTAVRAHFDKGHMRMIDQGVVTVPDAMGATGTAAPVAWRLHELIGAVPLKLGDFFIVNSGAFSGLRTPITEQVARSFELFEARTANFCAEPMREETAA